MTPEQVLQHYWGYSSFRTPQRELIESILHNKDVVGILPTGAGESVCFQVPTLLREGLCVVVTPLIALMQDQVAQLKQKEIPAIAIHSGFVDATNYVLTSPAVSLKLRPDWLPKKIIRQYTPGVTVYLYHYYNDLSFREGFISYHPFSLNFHNGGRLSYSFVTCAKSQLFVSNHIKPQRRARLCIQLCCRTS
ncbi:MAG: DEAD/DEAH box helicase [Cytophagales bacterium]